MYQFHSMRFDMPATIWYTEAGETQDRISDDPAREFCWLVGLKSLVVSKIHRTKHRAYQSSCGKQPDQHKDDYNHIQNRFDWWGHRYVGVN